MEYINLNDGVEIPASGFGTFLIPPDGSTYRAVREALDVGYRHSKSPLFEKLLGFLFLVSLLKFCRPVFAVLRTSLNLKDRQKSLTTA